MHTRYYTCLSILCSAVLAACFASPAHAQIWEEIHSPNSFVSFAHEDLAGNLYAQYPTGNVFRSTDGGATWKRLLIRDLPASQINFVDSLGVIYASAPDSTLTSNETYRSSDHGVSWELGPRISSYNVFPQSDGSLLKIFPESGIQRSTDKGVTWEKIGILPEQSSPIHATSRGRILAVQSQVSVFVSEDLGKTWVSHPYPVNANQFRSPALVGDRIYLPVSGLYTVKVASSIWDKLEFASALGAYVLQLSTPEILISSNGQGDYWRSVDGGHSWEEYTSGLPANRYNSSIASDRRGRLILSNEGRFFRTRLPMASVLRDAHGGDVILSLRGDRLVAQGELPPNAYVKLYDLLGCELGKCSIHDGSATIHTTTAFKQYFAVVFDGDKVVHRQLLIAFD